METVMMCRICHQSSGVVHLNIFESEDSKKFVDEIFQYLSIKISRDDGFSHLICHLCAFDLSLCSKLSEIYSSTCSGIISNLELNDRCCICGGDRKTVKVDDEITKLVEEANNCLNYKGNFILLKDTANKVVCTDCLFKLNEVYQFYSKVHRDVAEGKRCANIVPEIKEESINRILKEEEEETAVISKTNHGPSTSKKPEKEMYKKCKICKSKVKSQIVCKKCEMVARSVKVILTDLLYCKKK